MSVDKATVEKMGLTYWKMFKGNDPFTEVFTDQLPHRMILCPTEGYFLTEQHFVALLKTMRSLGESSFYLSEVEGEPDFINSSGHWEISADTTYDEYCQLPVYLENVLYSKSGRRGIIISHEENALFGGSSLQCACSKKTSQTGNRRSLNLIRYGNTIKRNMDLKLNGFPN